MEQALDYIHRGQLDDFVQLLNNSRIKALVQACDSIESAVLDYIISHDRHDFLDVLLQRSSSLLDARNKKQQTILHLAVANPSLRILDLLLLHHAKDQMDFLNAGNQWKETALHVAAGIGHVDIVKKLLDAGIDQSITDQWNRTAGDIAKENGNHQLLGDQLLHEFQSANSNSESSSPDNITPLIKQQGGVVNEFMSTLATLKSRHQVDTTNQNVPKVVVKSIFSQIEEKVVFKEENHSNATLLNGEITTVKSTSNNTNPSITTINSSSSLKKIALSKILEYPGDLNAVKQALNTQNYDVNGRDMYGLTALHKVASWDVIDILEYLLEQGDIDVNAAVKVGDQAGFTPLHCAIDMNAFRAINKLIEHPNIDLTCRDSKGRTALELGQQKNMPSDILQLLNR